MSESLDRVYQELDAGVPAARMRELLEPLGVRLGVVASRARHFTVVDAVKPLGIVWDPRAGVFRLPSDIGNAAAFAAHVVARSPLWPGERES